MHRWPLIVSAPRPFFLSLAWIVASAAIQVCLCSYTCTLLLMGCLLCDFSVRKTGDRDTELAGSGCGNHAELEGACHPCIIYSTKVRWPKVATNANLLTTTNSPVTTYKSPVTTNKDPVTSSKTPATTNSTKYEGINKSPLTNSKTPCNQEHSLELPTTQRTYKHTQGRSSGACTMTTHQVAGHSLTASSQSRESLSVPLNLRVRPFTTHQATQLVYFILYINNHILLWFSRWC